MGAQQNGTFYSNAIKDLDEVAQSTGRTLVTGKRKDVRAELKRRRDEYLKRRLEQRDERVEMQMRKWQALFAEMLIQWDVHDLRWRSTASCWHRTARRARRRT